MKLFYREKGNINATPLIILHGLWGASENWLPIANLLIDKFRVILPDLRNHGQSPHDERMDYDVMSEDINELIKTLNLSDKPILIGHSMGGKVLMNLLSKNTETVNKSIVIDIAPINYANDNNMEHLRLLDFIALIDLSAFDTWNQISYQIRQQFPNERHQQLLLKNIRKTPTGFQWKMNISAIQYYLPEILDSPIQSDTIINNTEILFIKGEFSEYIKTADESIISHIFPTAKLTIIPEATHWVHADQPQLLAETIRKFCNEFPTF